MTAGRSGPRKAAALLALHAGGRLLILPNVWNPIGARILQAKGYPAVATASAAVSASLGYEDGERIERSTLLGILGRIARSVDVPVTADIESGYGTTTADLEETIRAVIDAGIVGINLEDGREEGGALRSVAEQSERIAAVRRTASRLGLHLVINARIDSFLSASFASTAEAMEDAVTRAAAYAAAGADCVYPIGPGDEVTVRALRARIAGPMNVLGGPQAAPLATLESLGVDRVSFGPFVFRACLRTFVEIADALSAEGDPSGMAGMLSKQETGKYLLDGRESERRRRE